MNERQSDDVLKGRIIAMRSMIAQFSNEIEQIEGNLKSRADRKLCPVSRWKPPSKIYLFDMDGRRSGAEIVWCDDPEPDNTKRDVWEYQLVKRVRHAKY